MAEREYALEVITDYEGKKMLSEYGIKVPPGIMATDGALPDFDGPFAVKVVDPSIIHKTEAGGVKVNIRTAGELEQCVSDMKSRFPHSGIMVEQMIPAGVEIIAGIVRDTQFGLAIMTGLGGIYAELLQERSFRLIPVKKGDAQSMIRETLLSRFTEGFRGLRISEDAFVQLIMNMSAFAMDHKDTLAGMDLNPVIARDSEFIAADVKIVMRKKA